MHDERGARILRVSLVALAALTGTARADTLYGTLQAQYLRAEDPFVTLEADGTLRVTRTTRQLMLRALDVHDQNYLRPDLLMESSFRYTRQSTFGRPDVAITPQGSLRLIHPYFQFTATHQPATTRVALSPTTITSGAPADSGRSTTTRLVETMLVAHVSAPRGPQLDASWQRRRREGTGLGDVGVTRNARAAYERGSWNVYGSLGDQRQESRIGTRRDGLQSVGGAGGTLHLPAVHRTSTTLQYDFSGVRSRATGLARSVSNSQSASLASTWQPSPALNGSLNYQWRRADTRALTTTSQVDQEGSLLLRAARGARASLTGGGGVRTVRLTTRSGLQSYVTAVAAAQGDLRRNWNTSATLAHTTSWDPEHSAYGVETFGAATRMRVGRRAQLDGNLQLAANGDSASSAQRWSDVWMLRLQATPLRSLTLTGALRSQRVGPGLLRPLSVVRGRSLDALWRVAPKADVTASYGSTALVPGAGERTSSKSVTARYAASAKWQYQGQWSRADQGASSAAGGAANRHDLESVRVQYTPTRRVAASASVTVRDPSQARQTRQYDATFTWSFGR